MYNHLRGTLIEAGPARLVVETGGLGYEVTVPLSVARRAPRPGAEIRLLLHLLVREDAHQLVGFLAEEERALFRTLIGLQGVGPSLALRILSSCTPEEFSVAIERQDAASLRRIKGVGEKTAKRIILELKGARTALPAGAAGSGTAAEAAQALEAMGVPAREAADRVARALAAAEEELELEELIKAALR